MRPVLRSALLGLVIAAACASPRGVQPPPDSPRAATTVAFVDDRACAECHSAEYRRWKRSHHARAMQPATEATVLGDFRGVEFDDRGQRARFFRRGSRFMVGTEGPDGARADFEVQYTFGVAPLQQYLIALPGGRLQGLTIAWDTGGARWFALYPDRRFALDDPRHWTGRYQNWNLMCAECHSTNLRKDYDADRDAYRTTWGELGVGCQACHGPGRAHVKWARTRGADAPAPAPARGLLVDFSGGGSRHEVDTCARCHSRRVRLSAEEHPGSPLLDDFRPQLLRPGLYHPDGQQLGEVYEYGSFRQSPMYRRGVRCSDCHEPHGAALRAEGNALCTRCHRADGRRRNHDSPSHHFHRAGSAAAACVACHMPARIYMGVDARRDHRFGSPRPDLSVKLGTPNACNACHAERSAQWAADAVRRWYGPGRAGRTDPAEAIAAGRAGAADGAPALVALAADRGESAIVRATALDLLRAYGSAGVPAMLNALGDEDPVVRVAAAAGLDHLDPAERVRALAPLLGDPIRAVRIEAARALADVPTERLTAAEWQSLQAADAELRASQEAMADMPETHVEVGLLHEARGHGDLAERAYRKALTMDPYSVPARTTLAALYDATGQTASAEATLRDGLTRAPASAELRYALGLLLAETRRLSEAASELAEAVRLSPGRARVRYNYGLVLQDAGRPREAEAALLEAEALDPADADVVYALAVLYLDRRDDRRATTYARRFAELRPDDPRAHQLARRLRGGGAPQ